jgi:predicted amidohydrolase YtcJ
MPKLDIIFIEKKVKKYADKNTKIVDLKGLLMLPAFINSYTHFVSSGFQFPMNLPKG